MRKGEWRLGVREERMRSDPELERLLTAAADGSHEARGRLLMYYHDRLERAVKARLDPRLASRVDPSDVMQDILGEATRGLDGYLIDRPADFYVWVRGIAVRRVIDLHRRHLHAEKRTVRREARLPSDGAGADRFAGNVSSPSKLLLRAEAVEALRGGLSELSEDDREVLVLRYFEQLSLGEIATVLGISRTAAKSRHLRALERLNVVLAVTDDEMT